VLNPRLQDRPGVLENMPKIRRAEMERAREILGVRHAWLGFVDSGLPEGDPLPPLPDGCFALIEPDIAAEPLVSLIREFRPQVVLTYDENGGYPHPDHVMCHRVSTAAFDAAGDPERYPGTGDPWQPLKLYYHMGWSKQRILGIHEALLEAGLESPYVEWIANFDGTDERGSRVTTRVVCAEWFPQRDAALRAHETQVNPDGSWFAVPMAIQQAVWPTEDYELARSLVDTPIPEDDLFAGVREAAPLPL
jgi:mycothiol S-conjugate amidase